MALCSYSSDTHSGSFLVIENTFINEYLPIAPAHCVKVYLYGLYLCTNPNSVQNTIDNLCHTLSMDASEVKEAFEYWQAEGLVQILESPNKQELAIKYLPVSKRAGSSKKRASKYESFNSKIQALITGRMITPTEYNEYYTLLESFHMGEQGLIDIAEYCVKLKGSKVGYPYILTIAKNFANDGYLTDEQIKEKLSEHDEVVTETNDIIKQFTSKNGSTLEDRSLYLKWTNEFGFSHGTIKEVAKTLKGKPNATSTRLDNLLTKYHNLHLASSQEIDEYNNKYNEYLTLAKDITRAIGLYYDNLDIVIETYITDWVSKGYDATTLKILASYCFKRSIRTLEGLNGVIAKFYKLGLVTEASISQYMQDIISSDEQIKKILDKCGILRNVNSWDRDAYRTWTESWHLGYDIIDYSADFAKGKMQPIQYLNKLLSSMFDNGVKTLEDAKNYMKKSGTTGAGAPKVAVQNFESRTYDQKELDALFDNLDNIEI